MYTETSVRAAPRASMDKACNRRVNRMAPILPNRYLRKTRQRLENIYVWDECNYCLSRLTRIKQINITKFLKIDKNE